MLSQERIKHFNIIQSIYFAYDVGIISSYSNRICYRRIAKSRTKVFGSCMRLLEQRLRNNFQQVPPRLPATMPQPFQSNIKG